MCACGHTADTHDKKGKGPCFLRFNGCGCEVFTDAEQAAVDEAH